MLLVHGAPESCCSKLLFSTLPRRPGNSPTPFFLLQQEKKNLPVFARRLNAWLANGSFSVVNVFTDRVLLHFGVEINRENVQIIPSVFGVAYNSRIIIFAYNYLISRAL